MGRDNSSNGNFLKRMEERHLRMAMENSMQTRREERRRRAASSMSNNIVASLLEQQRIETLHTIETRQLEDALRESFWQHQAEMRAHEQVAQHFEYADLNPDPRSVMPFAQHGLVESGLVESNYNLWRVDDQFVDDQPQHYNEMPHASSVELVA